MTEADHIAELEAELKDRDEKIERLRADLAEALDTVDQARERIADSNAMIDRWIEVFDLRQEAAGSYVYDSKHTELWDAYLKQLDINKKLVRDWNKFADRYNRTVNPQPVGRPLRADEKQIADVKKRRTAGDSLRKIAKETGLPLRTVRTIVEKEAGTDRTTKKRAEMRRLEFNRLRAADFRARHRNREALPKQIGEAVADGQRLLKAIKGLGKG